jgi:hypothetical protein
MFSSLGQQATLFMPQWALGPTTQAKNRLVVFPTCWTSVLNIQPVELKKGAGEKIHEKVTWLVF